MPMQYKTEKNEGNNKESSKRCRRNVVHSPSLTTARDSTSTAGVYGVLHVLARVLLLGVVRLSFLLPFDALGAVLLELLVLLLDLVLALLSLATAASTTCCPRSRLASFVTHKGKTWNPTHAGNKRRMGVILEKKKKKKNLRQLNIDLSCGRHAVIEN
jgi:hypothetical protein